MKLFVAAYRTPSRGSTIAWYTGQPGSSGPSSSQSLRASSLRRRNNPFLVPTGRSTAIGEDASGSRRCQSKQPEVMDGKARGKATQVPGRESIRRSRDHFARGRLAALHDRLGRCRGRQGLVQHGLGTGEAETSGARSTCLPANGGSEQLAQVGGGERPGRTDGRGRRRPDRQAREEVPRQGRVSVAEPGGNAGQGADRAREGRRHRLRRVEAP